MRLPKHIIVGCLALSAGWAATAARAQQQAPVTPVLRIGRYDKNSEVIVNGTVQSIQTEASSTTMARGTYLVLQSTPLTWKVHMGLFASGSIPLKPGDVVAITGSVVSVNGRQILLARRVQSGNLTLNVRSSNGFVLRVHPAGQTQGGLQ